MERPNNEEGEKIMEKKMINMWLDRELVDRIDRHKIDKRFPTRKYLIDSVLRTYLNYVEIEEGSGWERRKDDLSDNEIEKHLVSNIYNLIWSITGGKSGTEWEE